MSKSFVGRGSSNEQTGRFEPIKLVKTNEFDAQAIEKVKTQFFEDASQTIVSKNNSPDLHFNYSLNPYRGCAHGCSYCYARPSHEYLGWGPGVDFESKIVIKRDAGQLFRQWLAKRRSDQIEPIMLSGVTDCYQPVEKELEITRDCLKAAIEYQHPIQIITKNRLIRRDIDLLTELAQKNLVNVSISVTTLHQSLTKILEPRTSSPESRLQTIAELSEAKIPVIASLSPIIPGINDDEIPSLCNAVKQHGASYAFYIMLRLPVTVKDVFVEWLEQHLPDRKEKVLARIGSLRGGQLNSSAFGERMTGTGIWAEQINRMFAMFAKKYRLCEKPAPLSTDRFRRLDERGHQQMKLF